LTGTVVPFRRPSRKAEPALALGACAVTLCVVDGDIVLGVAGFELDLTPEQAREMARDLTELALDAEAGRG